MAIAQTGGENTGSNGYRPAREAAPPELPLTQWHTCDCEQDHTCTANHTPHHNLALCGVDCDTKKDAWRVICRR